MDYLIPCLINIVSNYYLPNSFIMKLFSLDGLHGSISYLLSLFNITTNIFAEYKNNIIERYGYYLILSIFNMLITRFIWINPKIISYILIMFQTPAIMTHILNSHDIRTKVNHEINITMSKVLSKLIEYLSFTYLDQRLTITYLELVQFVSNHNDILTLLFDIVKNIITVVLITHVKTYSGNVYYSLLKKIYKYKTGSIYKSYAIPDAKLKMINLIKTRNWQKLNDANSMKLIMQLYQAKTDPTKLSQFITDFMNGINKTLSIKTIMLTLQLFNTYNNNLIYLIPFTSLYFCKKTSDYIYIILSTIVAYFTNNYLVCSIISNLLPSIFSDDFIVQSYCYTYNKIKTKIIETYKVNKEYTLIYLTNILFIVCAQFTYDHNIFLYLLVSTLLLKSSDQLLLYILLNLVPCLSSYNLIHSINNLIMMYFLFDYIKNPIITFIINCYSYILLKFNISRINMFYFPNETTSNEISILDDTNFIKKISIDSVILESTENIITPRLIVNDDLIENDVIKVNRDPIHLVEIDDTIDDSEILFV